MSTEEIQVEQQQPAEDAGDASSTQAPSVPSRDEFYMRYYVGHRGRFGHEFLEFEIQPSGLLRYANDTRYRNDGLIRKEVLLQPQVVREFKNLVDESKIIQEDDSEWPMPSDDGSQELEIVSNGEHISFVVRRYVVEPSSVGSGGSREPRPLAAPPYPFHTPLTNSQLLSIFALHPYVDVKNRYDAGDRPTPPT